MTAAPWWPAGRPEVGDELAHDLAAVAMPNVMAELEALLGGRCTTNNETEETT